MSKQNELNKEQLGNVTGGELVDTPSNICKCTVCNMYFDATTVEYTQSMVEKPHVGIIFERLYKCPTCNVFVQVSFQ